MRENESAETKTGEGAEIFRYPESPGARFVPSWFEWSDAVDVADAAAAPGADSGPVGPAPAPAETPAAAEVERRVAEETRRSFETGRAQGIEEGRKAEREAQSEFLRAAEEKRVRQAAGLLEKFAREREQYFQAAEPEVVRLALAAAGRILRREAASDPLLLMGAVRAALGQVSGSTEVRLRVPAAELDLWTEAVALLPNLAVRPAVLAGEGMALGDCTIETTLGTADLGVRAQLEEIERALLGDRGPGRRDVQSVRRAPAAERAESIA